MRDGDSMDDRGRIGGTHHETGRRNDFDRPVTACIRRDRRLGAGHQGIEYGRACRGRRCIDGAGRLRTAAGEIDRHRVAADTHLGVNADRFVRDAVVVEVILELVRAVGHPCDHRPRCRFRAVEDLRHRLFEPGSSGLGCQPLDVGCSHVEGGQLRLQIAPQDLGLAHVLQYDRFGLLVEAPGGDDADRRDAQPLLKDLRSARAVAARRRAADIEMMADRADELRTLANRLDQVAAQHDDNVLAALCGKADAARGRRAAVEVAAKKAFGTADLAGVGSATWQALWIAARRFAAEAAYVGKPFPLAADDARCVLCHQALDEDARRRLQGFEEFISADLERQARDAEEAYGTDRRQFDTQRIRTASFSAIRRRVALVDAGVGRAVLRFLASTRLRRRICEQKIAGVITVAPPSAAPCPAAVLNQLEARTRAYADQLRNAAHADGRKTLEAERDELADRIALTSLLPKARSEVQRLKDLALIAKALPSTTTNQITKLGNDIADHVITPQLRDRFQSEIVALAANRVRVEIVRSGGRFGSPQYQVRFFANAAARVHDVLSEGEQTCVALAAFLAELATAPARSALVFDDPVTSLDHRWRKRVANRLVSEAAARQVIVFTHDLVFVHDLKDTAEKSGTSVKVMTVARGPAGAGIVADGLPWRGTSIKDRVDKLEKEVREAKPFHDAHDEDEYRGRAFKIYNGLRSTWERAIEDVAFNGVIVRHRDYVNTKHLRKTTVLTGQDCDAFDVGFKKCCDQTDAHDPSRARSDEPLSPDDILKDVRGVLELKLLSS